MSLAHGALMAIAPAPVRVPPIGYPAPFHALDVVLEHGAFDASFAKTLDTEGDIFAGHYPHFPIFPGVLIYEAFSQAIRYYAKQHALPIAGVSRIKSLRFLKSLYPGDSYRINLKRVKDDANGNIEFHLQCVTGDVPAASAVLIASRNLVAAAETDPDVSQAATAQVATVHPSAVLPQRYPMLLVDRMLALQSGQSVAAQKNVSISEPCYRHCMQINHPDELAYPHSLIIESFAQTVGLLLDSVWDMSSTRSSNVVVFGGFQDIDLHGCAFPGDTIVHNARLEHGNATSAIFCGHSSVNGKTIMSYKKLIGLLLPKQQLREAS